MKNKTISEPKDNNEISLTKRDVRYFNLAKLIASKSSYKFQMGAVVVKRNKPIGLGYNKASKTHPMSTTYDNTIHAELDAILGIDKEQLRGASIYVFREFSGAVPALAKPCKHCRQLLINVGISKVFYSINGGYAMEHIL